MNSSFFSRSRRWLALVLLALPTAESVHAARISEPDTLIYGRIVQRVGNHEFLLVNGVLNWTVRVGGPGGREYQLTTRLQPLGNGQYSYRLQLPHQVQAYDLQVATGKVPLTAAPASLQHVSITLDGRPLTVAAGAVASVELAQSTRASTQRVDLELAATGADSDHDGLPDWWEDANGFDKWDPTDAADAFPPTGSGNSNPNASTAPTFAAWRAAHFPNDLSDLDAFGRDDADQDGICNLLEYAFDLDPTQADVGAAAVLPRLLRDGERLGLRFRPRAVATDLEFHVEASGDLLEWRAASDELTAASPRPEDAAGTKVYTDTGSTENGGRFLRVRVVRR